MLPMDIVRGTPEDWCIISLITFRVFGSSGELIKLYPCKPQFYLMKVWGGGGVKGSKFYRFVRRCNVIMLHVRVSPSPVDQAIDQAYYKRSEILDLKKHVVYNNLRRYVEMKVLRLIFTFNFMWLLFTTSFLFYLLQYKLTSKRNASSKVLHNLVKKYCACTKQVFFLVWVFISHNCIQKIWIRRMFLSKIVWGHHFLGLPYAQGNKYFALKFCLKLCKVVLQTQEHHKLE